MTINEILDTGENRATLIALINKWLDTIYENNSNSKLMSSPDLYEDLRRKLIDKVELTTMDISLCALILKYGMVKLQKVAHQTETAIQEITSLADQLINTVKELTKE